MAEHLINQVTLWQCEHWLVLLLSNSFVHNINDFVLVLNKKFHLFDLIDFQSDGLRELIESLNEKRLVLGKSLDIGLVPLDVPVQVCDLGGLELDLLVQIDSLLSDDIQLVDLVLDNSLSLFKSAIDFFDLVLDFPNLSLGFSDHLIAVLNLLSEVVCQLLLLSLFKVF